MRKFNNLLTVALIFVTFAMAFLSGCSSHSYLENQEESGEDSEETGGSASEDSETDVSYDDTIYVEIVGAVNMPGVYELTAGSRLFELIDQAGGFAEEAYTDNLNQASVLEDGQKVTIYTRDQAAAMAAEESSSTSSSSDGRININTATVDELTALSGIGETRAEAIVNYREKNGDFTSTDQLTNVSGIGDSTYSKIADEITVN